MDTTLTENISDKISQILWGKSFVDVTDYSGTEHTFILRSLSIMESNYLHFTYKKEFNSAIEQGILTQDQLKRLFYAQEVWGEDEENRREKLEKELLILSNQLKDSQFHTVRKKKLTKKIKQTKEQIEEINRTEVGLFAVSAENRAEEVRRRLMIHMFTETINEEPYWGSKEEFMQSTDAVLLNNLIVAYFKNNVYSEEILRRIARSGEWRFRWVAAKHGEQLFGRSISEWSEMQNMLVYWSEYYDGIYESMDRPAEYIIEDDTACDLWVKDQNKKVAQSRAGGTQKKGGQKLDHSEQFIMVDKDDKEAIQQVQDLNPDKVREQLRTEFEQIKNSENRVKEWSLGNRKNSTPITRTRKGK